MDNKEKDWSKASQKELLEEAKRRYPVGTIFINLSGGDKKTITINTSFKMGDVYPKCVFSKEFNTTNARIFDDGSNKWAEIISTPETTPVPKFEIGEIVNTTNKGYEFCDCENKLAMGYIASTQRNNRTIEARVYSKTHKNWWYKFIAIINWYSESSLEKVEHEIEDKFIIGKWYKNPNWHHPTRDFIKFDKLDNVSERICCRERIWDGRYSNEEWNWGKQETCIEAKPEEYSQFLPEGHKDKIDIQSKDQEDDLEDYETFNGVLRDIAKTMQIDGIEIKKPEYNLSTTITRAVQQDDPSILIRESGKSVEELCSLVEKCSPGCLHMKMDCTYSICGKCLFSTTKSNTFTLFKKKQWLRGEIDKNGNPKINIPPLPLEEFDSICKQKESSKEITEYAGLKIGDDLPTGIITDWCHLDGNEYSSKDGWVKGIGFFSGNKRYIVKLEYINGIIGFLVSGTIDIYLKADGFREFMDSYNHKSPVNSGATVTSRDSYGNDIPPIGVFHDSSVCDTGNYTVSDNLGVKPNSGDMKRYLDQMNAIATWPIYSCIYNLNISPSGEGKSYIVGIDLVKSGSDRTVLSYSTFDEMNKGVWISEDDEEQEFEPLPPLKVDNIEFLTEDEQ